MPKREKWLIRDYFNDMAHSKNNNVFGAIIGKTGSGKTYSAISLAMHIDPTFTVDRIVFSSSDAKTIIKEMLIKGDSKGKVIVYEEAGVNIGHLDYRKREVKDFNFILQTMRASNIHMIFTAPDLSLISKSSRGLFKAIFRMKYINKKKNMAYAKCYRYDWNEYDHKVYLRPLVFKGMRIVSTSFPKPPIKLCREYEARKKEFLINLIKLDDEAIEFKPAPKSDLEMPKKTVSDHTGLIVSEEEVLF